MNQDRYLDALLSVPELEGPRVSPDGRWVAWTWYRAGPAADVYAAPTGGIGVRVAPAQGAALPVRLTDTADDTLLVAWAPDSFSVLVSQDHHGDERSRLFRVYLDRPGVIEPLTEPSPSYYLRGGQLHPNGWWLLYGANWDQARRWEIEPTWLYRHDLVTGERAVLARPERGCYYEPKLNRPGTHVLYERRDRHPGGRQVWLVDIDGQADREIVNAGDHRIATATWLPDGQRVLVRAETETHPRVGVWDLQTAQIRWLIDDATRNIESARSPLPPSPLAIIVESRAARSHASLLNVDTGVETALPDAPGTLIPLAPIPGGEWVAEYYGPQQPRDLVRFSLGRHPQQNACPELGQMEEPFTSLTRIWERTALKPPDLTPAEDLRWHSVDGLEIQGWLYRSSGPVRGTVVHLHGGPNWHSQAWLSAEIQFLVSQGFHVLDPNYRGSTGFSRTYREAIKEDGWGGREQDDIRAGIEALLAAGIAQPGKVGITGTSFGGYSAWVAVTRWPREIVAAAAPICGMTDLVVDYETTRPDLRPLSESMMGGSPAQVPEKYRERSPLHFVDRIRGRLLIVQGRQDPNVTPENIRVVRTALEAAGVAYELLVFDDEGHGISRPANQRLLYQRLAAFFTDAFST